MFRMLFAGFVVYLLLPDNVEIIGSSGNHTEPVSAGQTLDAANAVIKDVKEFCLRNEHACDTGKALISNTKNALANSIESVSKSANSDSQMPHPNASTSENSLDD